MATLSLTVNGQTSSVEIDDDVAEAAIAFGETPQSGRPPQIHEGGKMVDNTSTGQEWTVKQLADQMFNFAAQAENVAREAKRPSITSIKTVAAK